MPASPDAIESLVAPAVIIPACGLLVLSISARLNTVIGRIRTMHSERIDAFLRRDSTDARWCAVRDMRIEGIDMQTGRMLRRCRLMQRAIQFLYAAVILLVVTSIMLALSSLAPTLETAAAYTFATGLIGVMGSMFIGIWEIGLALETVTHEHDRVCSLVDPEPPEQKQPDEEPPTDAAAREHTTS